MTECNSRSRERWIVLIPRLPAEPSRHRVAVWRELRRAGAIQIGQGSWAMPAAQSAADLVAKVQELVARGDGEVLVLDATGREPSTIERLIEMYDDARRAEWAEFGSECDKCVAELRREIDNEKFTLAELDEEEQNVDRLRRWHRELTVRDLFDALPAAEPQQRLDACSVELDRFSELVYRAVGLT